jgi:hypothetical protein
MEYGSFGEPNRGLGAVEDVPAGDAPYSGEGYFNAASLQPSGEIIYIALVTDQGEVPLAMAPDSVAALDCDRVRITGIIPADGGPVTVTSWEDATPAPLADEQKSLVEAF